MTIGHRTSVVLEREGDHVTGFKVYGHSALLIERLLASIGWPERGDGAEPEYPTMRRGDLDDVNFVRYLKALERAAMI